MSGQKNIDKLQNAKTIEHIVTGNNIKKGMDVLDSEGRLGKVIDCEDLHNVHVIFEGGGLEIQVQGETIICGGFGLYCLVEACEENSLEIDPLYCFVL